MVRGVPVCETCGYELSGVGSDGRQTPCPECGAWFTAQSPFVPGAWFPGAMWAIPALCGPTVVVMAGVVWLARSEVGQSVLMVAMPLLLLLWPVAVVALPALVAGKLVKRRVLRGRRTRVGVAIALGALVANIAITAALLVWMG